MCLALNNAFFSTWRSQWMKPRSNEWWRDAISGRYGSDWWRSNLRMSKDTFNLLCSLVRPYIERQTCVVRQCVNVEQRVAVTLYKLATNIEYRTLSNLFGLGKSTVCTIVLETSQVIALKLLPKYVAIPEGEGLKEVVKGFEDLWGFPQAAGAIDGSHIPIMKPHESASDYYNRKGFYSIIVQALVDHKGRFMDVYIGWPGKVHDARVFANSSLYTKGCNGDLFQPMSRKIGDVNVPLVILGDPAYPLLPWLMKPYVENEHTPSDQKLFNYRQSRARMVVENSFGRLKGRWRCLLKKMDFELENVAAVVATCIVLHNLCEMYGDACRDEWIDRSSPFATRSQSSSSNLSSTPAATVRNAIKTYLSTHQ